MSLSSPLLQLNRLHVLVIHRLRSKSRPEQTGFWCLSLDGEATPLVFFYKLRKLFICKVLPRHG